MARHCPICGKAETGVEFYGELCLPCAKSRLPPLQPVKITLCQKCGSLIDKGRNRKDASLSEEVVRLLKLKGKNADFDIKRGLVGYDTPFGRVSQSALVLQDKSICTICGRAGTQYFEAIVQLRGEEGKVMKMSDSLVGKLQKKTFVPKIEEKKEGMDIYVGSRNEAIAAINAFSLSFVRTEKLAGERDGKRLYRTTLLVRL